MQRKITGFHLDEERHWVADLDCGHGQHMRHDPPWMLRPWVLTEAGRQSRIGKKLECKRCEEPVDILEPETWIRYKPTLCRNCFAGCCTLPVRVDAEDLFHMGFVKYEEVNGPLERIARRLIKQGVLRSFNRRKKLFTLKRRPNSDCIFLDEHRRCVIYDRRPSVCRQFPANAVRPGRCPHQKK